MRSRPPAATRSAGSWSPGSSSRAIPAISVALDGDVVRLTQQRFAPSLPDDRSTWPVPLIVRQITPDGDVVQRVLVEAAGLDLPLAHPDAIVVANAGSTAFVRTFYDDELRARLTRQTRSRTCRPAERQSLVDDAWATVVAGQAGIVVVPRPGRRIP